jgi:3D (Asp-Asp-Asp) domain-containing protein
MFWLSRHTRRKVVATGLAAVVFMLLYQATAYDSRHVGEEGFLAVGPPEADSRVTFQATAYCKGHTTASGVAVRAGIAAGDPRILPIGSVIRVDGVASPYQGIYTVLDTGPAVQGRIIDLYMWSCHEALAFGRKHVNVTVLRRGWQQTQAKRSRP